MRARSVEYLINEACRVLAEVEDRIWDGDSLPVPIEAIATDHYGLLVREVGEIGLELPQGGEPPIGSGPLSGALLPDRAEIWIDATETSRDPQRRRLAIAHELGHWELHRGPNPIFCLRAGVDPIETVGNHRGASAESWMAWKQVPRDPQIEWEANVFAGAMLMPPDLVRDTWDAPAREAGELTELAERLDVPAAALEAEWLRKYVAGGE